MNIKFRNYKNKPGITQDYYKVREFLLKLGNLEFTFARWDWMITHSYLNKSALKKIGIWEENDQIVGIAIYDIELGNGYCLVSDNHICLKEEMFLYAKDNLSNDGNFSICVSDHDQNFKNIVAKHNFIATTSKENDTVFLIDKTSTEYSLPQGFSITSLAKTFDLYQYARVLWKGFDHEKNGEGLFNFTEKIEKNVKEAMKRPNVDLNLKIAAVSPEGNFVSYCGIWFDKEADFAIIEPVATDPDYRKMGLGKAAVLEGIKRVGELGVKKVFVGSAKQFYYSIGMQPFATSTMWKEKQMR